MTEYDVVSSAVAGIYNFIEQRYPTDRILQEKVRNALSYSLRLGKLIGEDEKCAKMFYKEIMEERKIGCCQKQRKEQTKNMTRPTVQPIR